MNTIASPRASARGTIRLIRGARGLDTSPPELLLETARAHGPLVRLPLPGKHAIYLLSDPETIREALTNTGRTWQKGFVGRKGDPARQGATPLKLILGNGLVTSSGETHKRQRRLMQPLFHRDRIAGYAEDFSSLSLARQAAWRDGAVVDMHREMTELTLDIIARTVFDVDLNDEVIGQLRAALSLNEGGNVFSIAKRRRQASEIFDACVSELLGRRQQTGVQGRSDLMSLLLSTRDEAGEPMPDQQVRDEVLTILLAGHETTANALTWTFHLLATHPEVQQALHRELDEVLDGRVPTLDDVANLRWTRAIFAESMRVRPPVWTMIRHLASEHEVLGHLLPAGSTFLLSQFVVHHDERWWPQPDAFWPERWFDEEAAAARPRLAFVPFGAGIRQCIGNSFAELEGHLCLAAIAQRWQVLPTSPEEPRILARVTLQPKGGLPLRLHAR